MKPGPVYRLIQELKRRRVFRGIVVYGASTLILLEAANNISNSFGLDAAPPWVLWVLVIGFFGSLWFSWIYDITPGGIKKTKPDSDKKVPIPKKEVRAYQTTTFVSVLIIIGLISYNIVDGAKSKRIHSLDKSIAVLPFYDPYLSPGETRKFEFIGQEITACLVKVKDYRVVPWEHSRKYFRSGKNYLRMGQDLSAAILVDWKPWETEVDKHLSVDLISLDEGLLWSENYEIEGNWPGAEICKFSRKISKKITRELRTYLTPEERALLSEQPFSPRATMFASLGTAMAQDAREMLYMGSSFRDTIKSEYLDSISFARSIVFFNEAIKTDSTFAEAYAHRAKARLWGMYIGMFDNDELILCEEDIRKAFELEPNLPEAHVAMGFYYYYGINEPQLAIISFEKAVELQPDNYEYVFYLSVIQRALGHWDQVHTLTDKVWAANPPNVLYLTNLGISYFFLREFQKAIACQDKAIELNPQWFAPYINKASVLLSLGDLKRAREVIEKAREETVNDYYRMEAEIAFYERKYFDAAGLIEQATIQEFQDFGETPGDADLLKAQIHRHNGNSSKSRENYRMAMDYYTNTVMFDPENSFAFSRLGLAYAGLGVKQKAIENGQKALELINNQENKRNLSYILYDMLQIYALTGERESAIQIMETLLDMPAPYTLEFLQLDPDLYLILNDPI